MNAHQRRVRRRTGERVLRYIAARFDELMSGSDDWRITSPISHGWSAALPLPPDLRIQSMSMSEDGSIDIRCSRPIDVSDVKLTLSC